MIDRQGKIAVNSGTSLVQETKKELRLLRNNRMSSAKDTRCHTGLQNWIRLLLVQHWMCHARHPNFIGALSFCCEILCQIFSFAGVLGVS